VVFQLYFNNPDKLALFRYGLTCGLKLKNGLFKIWAYDKRYQDGILSIAKEKDKVVGLAYYTSREEVGCVKYNMGVFVHKKYRRYGIGAELIRLINPYLTTPTYVYRGNNPEFNEGWLGDFWDRALLN